MDFQSFLQWEQSSRDTIDFKKVYVDMAGDVLAGLALSEIMYWHLPSKNGESKMRVNHNDKEWIACSRKEWWDRARIKPRQMDRVFKALVGKGLIEKIVKKFNGSPTIHICLNKEVFLELWETASTNPLSPNGDMEITKSDKTKSPNGEMNITESGKSITESTTEITTEEESGACEIVPMPESKPSKTLPKKQYKKKIEKFDPPELEALVEPIADAIMDNMIRLGAWSEASRQEDDEQFAAVAMAAKLIKRKIPVQPDQIRTLFDLAAQNQKTWVGYNLTWLLQYVPGLYAKPAPTTNDAIERLRAQTQRDLEAQRNREVVTPEQAAEIRRKIFDLPHDDTTLKESA